MGEVIEVYSDASRTNTGYVIVQSRNGEKLIMLNIICILITLVMILCKQTQRDNNNNLRGESTTVSE